MSPSSIRDGGEALRGRQGAIARGFDGVKTAFPGRFLEWLKHIPADEDRCRLSKDQLEDTYFWIDHNALISSSLREDTEKPSLLWISGGPRTGKTVLAAHIITELNISLYSLPLLQD